MSDHLAGGMEVDIGDVERALSTVQRTLDALNSRGHSDAAFDLARAQYAASIRSSWPGNLGVLAGALEKLLGSEQLGLSDRERGDLARAAAVFRKIRHP